MKTISLHGMPGSGRTIFDAKRDAGEKIESLLRHRAPRIYSHNGSHLVFWHDGEHDYYTICGPESDGQRHFLACCGSDPNALEHAFAHLLDYDRQVGAHAIPDWIPQSMRARLVSAWRDNDAFQLAYRHAASLRADELPRGGCHEWACNHAPEFLGQVDQIASQGSN